MPRSCRPVADRFRRTLLLWASVTLLGATAPCGIAAEKTGSTSRLESEVLAILQRNCARCHGATVHKGDLDLTSAVGLWRGGTSGAVIVPKKPGDSRLYTVLHEGRMPPKKESPRPTSDEIATIRRWIETDPSLDSTRAIAEGDLYHASLAILRLRCMVCHGPRKQEGGLSLASCSTMLKGGKSGPAIRPGVSGESLLVRKVHSGQMPPRDRMLYVGVIPMTAAELAQITRWIDQGAPETRLVEDVATTTSDALVTDADRNFWAFRPPRRPAVPVVRHRDQLRNPLDAFVLARLEAKGLTLSPEADRLTLLRRATFDLTGLPPSPEDVRAFLDDAAPDAYERLIDRLLASPRYGERWGRTWLDLAGYADSESKLNYDYVRPHAFRYRDYVIRAFNADTPYDRFLTEQLAGDELVDYQKPATVTAETVNLLAATGFLKMTPDPTDHELYDNVIGRLEVIADEMDVFGSAILGLTIRCARCHDHKFDPIPQRDYFRLMATFRGALDEHDWTKPSVGRVLSVATEDEKRRYQQHNDPLQRRAAALSAEIDRRAEPLRRKHFERNLASLSDVIRDDVRRAVETSAGKRDPVQRYLAEKFEKSLRPDTSALKMLEPAFKKEVEPLEKEKEQIEARMWQGPAIQALCDRGQPTPTQVYRRGDPLNRAGYVGPGVLSVLTDGRTPFAVTPPRPGATSTSRRLALARWLTQPDHPLTSRVMVNRLWRYHFGRGLVATLDNFGHTGARPTHPELLDWLATELVRGGWRLKSLHRLMMTSAVYRQASTIRPEHERLDPENVGLARMPLRRLEAEAVRDAMLRAAGRLDETPYGPADPLDVHDDGLVTEPLSDRGGWRRSIYVRQRRTTIPTLLETFDLPQMSPNCVDRRESCVATQALYLKNDSWVTERAADLARRVRREAGIDPARQVERLYLLALGRPPNPRKRARGITALESLADAWRDAAGKQASSSDPALEALTTYAHTVLNSAAFLYVD